mmetsp:Transcript_64653/g.173210  ORF Transcript_64653/g.173210 Transcript_64653/m.173210 type:complete len:276 (-) Transcript_64653:217-1044(-)
MVAGPRSAACPSPTSTPLSSTCCSASTSASSSRPTTTRAPCRSCLTTRRCRRRAAARCRLPPGSPARSRSPTRRRLPANGLCPTPRTSPPTRASTLPPLHAHTSSPHVHSGRQRRVLRQRPRQPQRQLHASKLAGREQVRLLLPGGRERLLLPGGREGGGRRGAAASGSSSPRGRPRGPRGRASLQARGTPQRDFASRLWWAARGHGGGDSGRARATSWWGCWDLLAAPAVSRADDWLGRLDAVALLGVGRSLAASSDLACPPPSSPPRNGGHAP